jgi:hypothetical protein
LCVCSLGVIVDSDERASLFALTAPPTCRYVSNTHGSTHAAYKLNVRDVFELGKDLPWAGDKIKNRKLLWHGSRLTNWPGILKHGLKIAPPEAPVTGYMFGKVNAHTVPAECARSYALELPSTLSSLSLSFIHSYY